MRVTIIALAAVTMAVAACDAPGSPTTTPTPSLDMDAVRQQFRAAVTVETGALSTVENALAADQGNLSALQQDTRTFRTAVFSWDKAVRAITFPDSAKADVNALLQADSTEIAALDKTDADTDLTTFNTDLQTASNDDDATGRAESKVRADIGLPPASSSPAPTATATATASAAGGPADLCGFSGGAVKVIEATHDRDVLLSDAPVGTAIPQGYPPAWAQEAYTYVGGAVSATPSGNVSGCAFVVDKTHNEEYLSFAVQDYNGNCAGGDLVAAGSGNAITSATPVTVPAGQPCTGATVAAAAGHT